MRRLLTILATLLVCLWPLGSIGAPTYGNPGGYISYYGIAGSIAGEEALATLYELKELKAPQRALRKLYFSSAVGGDIPTIGLDTNDCLSIDAPCLTFARATVVCGALSDCIFDAQDTWTGADVAADPALGGALRIATSSIGGDFVSTRIRSSDPTTRVAVNCLGTTWAAGADGVFVVNSGTDWVSFEGFAFTCDGAGLAVNDIDGFDGKQNTRVLIINSSCTMTPNQVIDQCFTTHGAGAVSTGGLLVAINTEASNNLGEVMATEPGSESTLIAIGEGLYNAPTAAANPTIINFGEYTRAYVIGHSFTGTGTGSVAVFRFGAGDCDDCYVEMARTNVSDMDDTGGNDGTVITSQIGAGILTLVLNQTTVANQDRAYVFSGAAGTVTWNGGGNLLENIDNYDVWVGADRSTGGAAPLTGTLTECVYDLSGALDFYADGGARATLAAFNAAMDGFSFCEDAGSVDGEGGTLLADSSACDPADADCFNAFDGSYTIVPLFLDAGITFPADILGTSFTRFTLTGGNVGGR